MIGPTVGFTRTAFRAGTVVVATMLLAALAVAAGQPVKYVLDPGSSLLRFNFEQAGANNTGRFGKYAADVVFSADNLAASKIDVSIDVASLDTGDKERDDTLKGADLFDTTKFPKARFVSSKITMNGAGRYEATGKLTIRNVTKDFKLPITFQTKEEKGKTGGIPRRSRDREASGIRRGSGRMEVDGVGEGRRARHLLAEARSRDLRIVDGVHGGASRPRSIGSALRAGPATTDALSASRCRDRRSSSSAPAPNESSPTSIPLSAACLIDSVSIESCSSVRLSGIRVVICTDGTSSTISRSR